MQLQRDYERFRAVDAEVVALSTETLEASTRLATDWGIEYPVLADPDHQVIESYGVYNLLGDQRATPSVFIVNEQGIIIWKYVGKDTVDRPDNEVILEQLR